jgi:hypothetical protein
MKVANTKWSDDAFLDQLRSFADPEAEHCVYELHRLYGDNDFHAQFHQLTTNDAVMPAGLPKVADDFFEKFHRLPIPDGKPVDMHRIRAGQKVFLDHSFLSCVALLLKSVPEGYQATCLTAILHRTRGLDDHTYLRLLGVLQMVVNVCCVGGFEPKGEAIITANKLRLLHAGIRYIVAKKLPDYRARFGEPVNHEDMLGTIMGFSLLVVDGLQRLGVPLSAKHADDYYYVWTVFAQVMGIHPPGNRDDTSFVPQTLDEAREFYRSYARRHYKAAAENPEGVELTAHLLGMVRSLLPETFLKHIGLGHLPRMYMEDLIGNDATQALGVRPMRSFSRFLLNLFPRMWRAFWRVADRFKPLKRLHEKLGLWFLRGLIEQSAGGSLQAAQEVARKAGPLVFARPH